MKRIYFLSQFLFSVNFLFSQSIGIGTATPDASAQLDITNTGKGLLIPRMSTSGISSISNPAKGLMVYDSVKNQLMVNMGSSASPNWQTIVFNSGWSLAGNSGTDTAVHFIGTSDNEPLRFKVNNEQAGLIDPSAASNTGFGWGSLKRINNGTANTALGYGALFENTTGIRNVAIGSHALRNNSTGSENVAIGDSAGFIGGGSYNTIIGRKAGRFNTGFWNTIIGFEAGVNNTAYGNVFVGSAAGEKNTSGSGNSFVGDNAGRANITGSYNSFFGSFAGGFNITGFYNTANGTSSLSSNSNGGSNTAIGFESLRSNTGGNYNTAAGATALRANIGGVSNSAIGYQALYTNTSGGYNTGNGVNTLYYNSTASNNTATGFEALFYNNIGASNTATGFYALRANVSGSFNTAIGAYAGNNGGTNPANFTAIGYNAGHVGSGSNSIEIGNTSVSWIGGMVGWSTYFSDARAKEDINDNVPGLSFISKLRPVTYRLSLHKQNEILGIKDTAEWEGKYDIEKIVQTGFVAQEVEQAAKELNFDFNGVLPPMGNRKLYSMQYSAFVVPLVKAVQELADRNSKLTEHVGGQQTIIENQQKQIDELKKQVQVLINKQ